MDRPIKELVIPQQVFDMFVDQIDKFVSFHVKNEGTALIMAEALIVKKNRKRLCRRGCFTIYRTCFTRIK